VRDKEGYINVLGVSAITQDCRGHYHSDRYHRFGWKECSHWGGLSFLTVLHFLAAKASASVSGQ
jgi:hypothetical protein